jgi:hypothetical protein
VAYPATNRCRVLLLVWQAAEDSIGMQVYANDQLLSYSVRDMVGITLDVPLCLLPAGAESSTLSYVAGLKEVRAKSMNAALSGCVGTEFDRLC